MDNIPTPTSVAIDIDDNEETALLRSFEDANEHEHRHDNWFSRRIREYEIKTRLVSQMLKRRGHILPEDARSDRQLQRFRLELAMYRRVEGGPPRNEPYTKEMHALHMGFEQSLELLSNSERCYLGQRNRFGNPPLLYLSSPVLSDFFDTRLRGMDERTDNFAFECDCSSLVPPQSHVEQFPPPPRVPSEMDVLVYIAESRDLKDLLLHPLLSVLLYLKRHRVRYFLNANLIFYVFFYILVNVYIYLTSYCPRGAPKAAEYNATTANVMADDANAACQRDLLYLRALATVALLFLAICEIVQLISSPRRYYSHLEIVQLVLLFVGVSMIVAPNNSWIRALLVLISVWKLFLLMGHIPSLAVYIQMLKTVGWYFSRYVLIYAILILAFALAFFTLFRDETNFHDLGSSLFKTILMLTGESDASDIPFDSSPIFGRWVFILFLLFMAVVLFNLLTGFIQNVFNALMEKSKIAVLVSRVHQVSYIESVVADLARFSSHAGHIARNFILFPDDLPDAKIAVSAGNSNWISVNGKHEMWTDHLSRLTGSRLLTGLTGSRLLTGLTGSRLLTGLTGSRLSMDSSVVERVREIFAKRDEIVEKNRETARILKSRLDIEKIKTSITAVVDAPFFLPSLPS